MAKAKREEMADAAKAAAEGDYEFKLPAFDEKAFIRREIQTARASFYTLGMGLAGGVGAVVCYALPVPWSVGWLPIIASLLFIRPTLQKLGFPEEVTAWKALLGSYFMAFFTGLAVWILGVNFF
jgi:hypothetical protein